MPYTFEIVGHSRSRLYKVYLNNIYICYLFHDNTHFSIYNNTLRNAELCEIVKDFYSRFPNTKHLKFYRYAYVIGRRFIREEIMPLE